MKHPAKYSDILIPIFAEILPSEGRVLDPFAGTGKLAKIKDFGFSGIIVCNEIEPEWVDSSEHNVDEWHIGDASDMKWAPDASFDAICTSPTYGNRMADHFDSTDGSKRITYRHFIGRPLSDMNTGRMQWGEKYRDKHVECYLEFLRILKNGGIMVVNLSNHIRSGVEVDVCGWHRCVLTEMGMSLIDEVSVITPRMGFGANGKARVLSEVVMVFKKQSIL